MSSPHHTLPENSKGHQTKSVSSSKGRKFMNVTVYFLDDSNHVFQLQAKNSGQALFDKVCKFLNLIEVDYFGLEFEDEKGSKCWLDLLKPLCSQLSTSFPSMYFCVKFYTPDPVQLEDEFTKYLFTLQLKKDLGNGLLQCNDNTTAVIVSYLVQADFGDFNPEKCVDTSYLSSFKFVPYQDFELERKIMENHKKLIGQSPAEADINLLETARRCELYGIRMTPAKDHEGVPLNLAVAHLGVLVFQNFTKINTFSWVKIRKLSFKRKKFLIKLHPEGYGYYKDTVEYFFDGRNECKNFWKKCIENHTFFRCTDAKQGMRQKPKIFSRGSSFRYSGRTQKQVSEFVRENYFKRPPFQRSTSLRTPSSPSRSIGSASISPQPLLPITSLSCGSISDVSREPAPPQKTFSTSEPTTPHVAQDITRSLNGDYSKNFDSSGHGVVSPDIECEQEGFQSSDFLAQDTDDNISHDSYHVLEKEMQKTNNECMLTNSDSVANNKTLGLDVTTALLTNGTNECEESSQETSGLYSSEGIYANVKLEDNNNILDNKPNSYIASDVESQKISDLYSKPMKRKGDIIVSADVMNGTSSNSPIKMEDSIDYIPNGKDDVRNIDALKRLSGDSKYLDVHKSSEQNLVSGDNFDQHSLAESLVSESQQSFGSSTFYVSSPTFSVRLSHKKTPTDRAYCLAKELLMTERTYRKDLQIVNVTFRDEFYDQKSVYSEAMDKVLGVIDPLFEIHCSLLRDLEQRLAFWEGRPVNRAQSCVKGVGDILLLHKGMIPLHCAYLEKLPHILELLHEELTSSHSFSHFYHQFESRKICYLPLTSFLLRPAFRLLYYSSILENVLTCYENDHEEYNYCKDLIEILKSPSETIAKQIIPVVNYVKLMELQRSLVGFSSLLKKNRFFVREGCLLKFSKTGSHQHMFFLFSDLLLYTARVHSSQLRFKVQGQLQTFGLKMEDSESKQGVSNCFSLCSGEKHIVIAAPSARECSKWKKDIEKVILNAKSLQANNDASSQSLKIFSDERYESGDDSEDFSVSNEEKSISHHLNTSIHICWHRNISISYSDLLISMKHSLSGYLLRKFKNNMGWQKLWVVLANLCLFFYKTYLDESPLASLPLAGYKVMSTFENDVISGDCIFKLQFKNHEYFFMVENKNTYERWMEAIHLCTLMDEENTHL
ncbi:FERM, ARHGEF and pleckstrin domain-containing protein 1-like [Uloborus diversus]|uniref:FERM, ARHGEF and pleckstrin domain-containing protein 1-like n=1 Tax=Uloborus diversus TaxID=327109 RepID=UPI0024091BB4|nr:FERM, ARHGEF and pleckstrin domain-containing protein 1-like [Uloborus diversus]